jgi:Alcohol dehydrogenase GroES-like domain
VAKAGSTYRAVHVVSPGKLELTEKPLLDPNPGHVRIRLEACGVCHSDSFTVGGALPIEWPRVPGHEAVGRIDALGAGAEGWKVGQRVGIGFLGGSCGRCGPCRNGDLVNCRNQEITGVHHEGGYAEVMIAKANGLGGHEGARLHMTGPEALTMTEMADRISRAVGKTVRYVPVSPIQRRQALIAHGVPPQIADALDRQVEERLKGGIESQVDLSTHQLFNVKPTTFLAFARRNAEAFGAAAAAA